MPEISSYAESYYSMTWLGPKGYPENANGGRCYFTGILGMLRHWGESDLLFADGLSGDGFSFRWTPVWGAPAFNGGKGPFHELWEYTPRTMGYRSSWEEDHEGGWEEAFSKLCALIDSGIPVQVGLHYSRVWPYGVKTSPRLAHAARFLGKTGFGHHVVIAGYDLQRGTVTVYEPNDVMPHARYECPITAFRQAWEDANQRVGSEYVAWESHHPWNGEWSLHDGYGPYLMVWIEPGKDPEWSMAAAVRHSYRRNLKILSGEYPKPYHLYGSQWQIPKWETGAPGMARCAEAIRRGELKDALSPTGEIRPLFVKGNIPNHGVLGRAGAAGYLRRVATELERHSNHLKPDEVRTAADLMQESSDLFRQLRYEEDLMRAGDILSRIADTELKALQQMELGWTQVRELPSGEKRPFQVAAE